MLSCSAAPTGEQIQQVNALPPPLLIDLQEMELWTPQQVIAWAVQTFGPDLAMTSSFQQQSLALLHMISQIAPSLPIFFLDTGYHFQETLEFKEQLTRQLSLNVMDIRPEMTHQEQAARHGPELYKTNPDLCCYLNKVRPLQNTMQQYRAWITGIRRDQSENRASAQVVEIRQDGMIKVNPLAMWTGREVRQYIEFHQLPSHPLLARGYKSIGCEPCTRPVQEGEDERSGRWAGTGKQECGLHTVFRVK